MSTLPQVQIGSLASSESGAFKIGPFGSSLKKSELVPAGVPVAGIENVLPNHFEKGFRRFITDKKFRELSDYEILPDDVLVTTMGTIGRAAVAPGDLGRTIIDSHLFRMRFDTARVYPPYVCHALNSRLVVDQLSRKARGAIMDGLNTSILKECVIPLPGLSEQQRIAGLLEQSDRLRRTRRYALELSDKFLAAAFFKSFGDLKSNSKGWDIVGFDEVCQIDAPLVDPRKKEYRDLLHIGGENLEPVTGRLLNLRTAEQDGLVSAKFLIDPEHVLFSKIRPKLRKVSEPKMNALCSADIYPIRANNGALNSRYLAGFLRSEYFTSIVTSRAESRANIPKVNREELSEIPVFVPPLSNQRCYADLVERHERMLATQREALRQAEHLFQTLLQRAFTDGL